MEAELFFSASCCMRNLLTQYSAHQTGHQQVRIFCTLLDLRCDLRQTALAEAAAAQLPQQLVLDHLPQALAPEGLAASLPEPCLFEPLAELIHLFGKFHEPFAGAGDSSHNG